MRIISCSIVTSNFIMLIDRYFSWCMFRFRWRLNLLSLNFLLLLWGSLLRCYFRSTILWNSWWLERPRRVRSNQNKHYSSFMKFKITYLHVIWPAEKKSPFLKRGCEYETIPFFLSLRDLWDLRIPQRYILRWELINFATLKREGKTSFVNASMSLITKTSDPSTGFTFQCTIWS